MPYQPISATVSAASVQAIKDAVATIEQKLPFLISLSEAERKKLFKTGPNRLSFVQNALTAAQDNPTILPASFDADEFELDVDLFTVMTEINTLIAQLASEIDDTRMAVGSEAISEASNVYSYVKTAVKTTPGLKPLADQLGQQFQQAAATRTANAKAKKAAGK
jgi:hypothetical protein